MGLTIGGRDQTSGFGQTVQFQQFTETLRRRRTADVVDILFAQPPTVLDRPRHVQGQAVHDARLKASALAVASHLNELK